MNQISPITETPDSVTLRRADFDALIAMAEDAIDNAAIEARETAPVTDSPLPTP